VKRELPGKRPLPEAAREALREWWSDAWPVLRPVWPVGAILLATVLLAWLGRPLPESLAGLRTAGPYALLVAAAAVAMWFNRGRAFVLAVSLLAFFGAYDYASTPLVYTAGAVCVFANAVLVLLFPERGARFGRAWRWLALMALEGVLVWYLNERSWSRVFPESFLLSAPPTPPLLLRIAFAVAFAAAVARAWPSHTPLDIAMGGGLAAFFIACAWVGEERVYSLFMLSAGAVLLVAVLQESYRMAFRDALTGLPNRRALEEQLRALKPPYTLAMVDVDHFKGFNDTHGHDIGDQVLRLVAARLAEVGGGGRAFRYGGEEFTVLFSGQRLAQAFAHLEASRASIEGYKMAMRGEDRPKGKRAGRQRRSAGKGKEAAAAPGKVLSVTVSMGAAEPGKRLKTPAEVIKAADEALYRAKEGGRNRVSR